MTLLDPFIEIATFHTKFIPFFLYTNSTKFSTLVTHDYDTRNAAMAHRSTQVRQKQFEVSARTSSEIAASPMPSAFTSTVPRITSAPATDGVSHVITRHPFTSTATRLQVDTPQSHHRRDVAPSMLASASVNSSTSTSSGNLPPRLPGTASAVSSKQSPTHSSIFSSPPTAIGKTVQDPLVARFERLKLTLSGEQNSPSQIGKSSQNTISSAREQPSFDDIKPARLSNNIMATSSPMLQGLTSQPTQYRPSSFVPRSQPVPKMSTRDTEPVVIDDSDEDESDGEQQPPPSRRRTFHRPNPFQRSSRMNTRVRESIGNKTQSISRRRAQRLRSTVSKNTALTGLSDSPNSSDVSYPDLSKALKEFENTPRSSTQLTTGVLAVSPKLRDRRVTARPQHPELVEQDVSQIPHTQTTVGVGVKSPVGVGTRDDPIDLDQWSLPEPMDVGRSGDEPYHASDVVQFSTDALLAHRLQKDEDRAEQTTIRARECAVCGDEYPVNTLPSLSACTHPPQTCGTCYAGWVTAQLQQSGWREAKCPESKCQTRLEYHDIQHIVSRDVFEQYDTYIARTALGEDRKFVVNVFEI